MIHLQALGSFILAHPLAIVVCVVAYMIIGFVWYGPLFTKPWSRLTGMDKVDKNELQKAMVPAMLTSVATGFVMTVVLGRGMQILAIQSWIDPLVICVVLWFPFTAMVMAQTYAYTMKSFQLLLIDAGYILVSMFAISMILFRAVL